VLFVLLMKHKAILGKFNFLGYLSEDRLFVLQNVGKCARDMVSQSGRPESSFTCIMLLEFTLYFSTNFVKFTLRYCKLFTAESVPLQGVASASVETK
jgi:hypothetical protein